MDVRRGGGVKIRYNVTNAREALICLAFMRNENGFQKSYTLHLKSYTPEMRGHSLGLVLKPPMPWCIMDASRGGVVVSQATVGNASFCAYPSAIAAPASPTNKEIMKRLEAIEVLLATILNQLQTRSGGQADPGTPSSQPAEGSSAG